MSSKALNEPIIISDHQVKKGLFEKCTDYFDDFSAKQLRIILPLVLLLLAIALLALWQMGPDPMV